MSFLGELVRSHGWHVVAELIVLLLATVFTVLYVTALARGRVHAVRCPGCGRIASRARAACPRCRAPLEAA